MAKKFIDDEDWSSGERQRKDKPGKKHNKGIVYDNYEDACANQRKKEVKKPKQVWQSHADKNEED